MAKILSGHGQSGDPRTEIKRRLSSGRVDFVMIGDSNQIFGGYGWDHGIQHALAQRAPAYATGLVSINEANGNGAGTGFTYKRSGPLLGAVSGAPAALHDFLDPGAGGLSPANYAYVDTSATVQQQYFLLSAGSILDASKALEFDVHWGGFTSGTGSFRPQVRLEQSPYSGVVEAAAISTNTGANTMNVATLALPEDATRSGRAIAGRVAAFNSAVTGPFFGTYYRWRDPSISAGWAAHTLNYRGGQSLRTMASDLQSASNATLAHYFGVIRAGQGAQKTVIVMVNSGLNDRNETSGSVGSAAIADGDGPFAFVDNFRAIKARIEDIWLKKSWDLSELFWIGMVSHPVSSPDDAELIAYRQEVARLFAGIAQGIPVDLGALTTSAEMIAEGWYASGGSDKSHLSQAGYEGLAARAISKILNAPTVL